MLARSVQPLLPRQDLREAARRGEPRSIQVCSKTVPGKATSGIIHVHLIQHHLSSRSRREASPDTARQRNLHMESSARSHGAAIECPGLIWIKATLLAHPVVRATGCNRRENSARERHRSGKQHSTRFCCPRAVSHGGGTRQDSRCCGWFTIRSTGEQWVLKLGFLPLLQLLTAMVKLDRCSTGVMFQSVGGAMGIFVEISPFLQQIYL